MTQKMCFLLIIMQKRYRLNRDLKGTVAKKKAYLVLKVKKKLVSHDIF